jgi:hypothetical protein
MNEPLADILGICLDSIEQGQMTIHQCLERYPDYRDELEPLLMTASVFQSAPEVTPSTSFRSAARIRLMNLISEISVTNPTVVRHHKQIKQPIWKRRYAMTWAIVIALIATLIGGGAAYASEAALPGDALYPVKTTIEDVQLALADDQEDANLLLDFAQERLDEMESLAEQGRYANMQVAAQEFEERLQQYAQVQTRLGYDGVETSGTQDRVQQLLQTQTRIMLHLQDETGEGDAVMEQIRNAVRTNMPENMTPPVPGEGAGNQQHLTETGVPTEDADRGSNQHQKMEQTPCPNNSTPTEDPAQNHPMETPDPGMGGGSRNNGGNGNGGKP